MKQGDAEPLQFVTEAVALYIAGSLVHSADGKAAMPTSRSDAMLRAHVHQLALSCGRSQLGTCSWAAPHP